MLTVRPSGTSARIPSVDEFRRRNGLHSHPLTLRIDPPGPFKWRQLYWPPTLERAIKYRWLFKLPTMLPDRCGPLTAKCGHLHL
jgi:hypothetical protein